MSRLWAAPCSNSQIDFSSIVYPLTNRASSGLQVGDQSDFVTAMGRTLQEFGPPLGAALPEHHFAFLCDKVQP